MKIILIFFFVGFGKAEMHAKPLRSDFGREIGRHIQPKIKEMSHLYQRFVID